MKIVTLKRLKEFLNNCRTLFALKSDVNENDVDLNTYVLNFDYTDIAFDTSEIIK